MKNKVLKLILISSVITVLVSIALNSMGTERLDQSLQPLNKMFRPMMGFPEQVSISQDGHKIDSMIVYVHVLMGVLFVGWLGYFFYTMIFFRAAAHPRADYHGFKSTIPTTIAEVAIIFIEMVLIVCFAIPLWAGVMDAKHFPQGKPESRRDLQFVERELDPETTPRLAGKTEPFQADTNQTHGLHSISILSTRPATIQIHEGDATGSVVFTADNHKNIELLYSNYRTNRASLAGEGKERLRWTGLAALKPGATYTITLLSEKSDAAKVIFAQSEEVSKLLGQPEKPFRVCEVKVKTSPTLVVRVVAEQFSWNTIYPGVDGNFGRQDMRQASVANPFGRLPGDSNGLDDLDIKGMKVPVHAPVIAHISSKDVIHSFKVVPMRVCQDAIPGLRIPLHFRPTEAGKMSITCAQLCGDGHAAMRGEFEVLSAADYATWWNKSAGWWMREKPVVATASFE